MKPLDDRLKRTLEARGVIDGAGVGRRVQSRLCPRCGRATLAGCDAPTAGHTVRVDPVPLDVWGELAALMADVPTHDLSWTGARYELDYRLDWHIKAHPAGTGRADVVAEHRCGRTNVAATTSNHVFRSAPVSAPGGIPF